MTVYTKGLPLIDLMPGERRLIDYLVANCRHGRWTIFDGASVGDVLANQMGWDRRRILEALSALKSRGWVAQGRDMRDRPMLVLNKALGEDCQAAIQRSQVRNAAGWRGWARVDGDDDLADEIWLKMQARRDGRWGDEVRKTIRQIASQRQV